jgi:hypothetical protein
MARLSPFLEADPGLSRVPAPCFHGRAPGASRFIGIRSCRSDTSRRGMRSIRARSVRRWRSAAAAEEAVFASGPALRRAPGLLRLSVTPKFE